VLKFGPPAGEEEERGFAGGRPENKPAKVDRLCKDYGRMTGDNLRHGLSGDLGSDAGSRAENVRRAGEAARMMADAGLLVIVALVSPYAEHRDRVRRRHAGDELPFVEVWVDTPLEVCEERDPKGLYRRARAGTLHGLTGVDDPYEPPADPDLVLDGTQPLQEGVERLEAFLADRGLL
jgi:bifunctional enzyme CysN/CysC